MYKQLITVLLAAAGYSKAAAAAALGYNSPAAFQSAIQNQDIKLSVLANVCKLCKCDITITNSNGVSISVLDYINQQQQDK